ncbi:hypothetical protein ACQEVZ_55410 [Dactylosporangium sp. CA-152071]|uniref:hypothetical protein n=1 Tax=Dactylosporangium sp. CA-152071 TaxID=3239933 RepID=UPI003D8FDFFD
MGTEFVYCGHVRELLGRVAAGADLRPATEICLTLSEVSAQAPMHGPGAGLYVRMWLAAFPDGPVTADQADNQRHYEHLHGPQIDELETTMRRKGRRPRSAARQHRVHRSSSRHGRRLPLRRRLTPRISVRSTLPTL